MCANTPDCTHYAWAYNVCYKKRGSVNKQMAIVNHTPGSVCGIVHETPISGGPNRGQLIFSNEFDSINEVTQNWIQETGGHGWGNNELQYYTNGNHNLIVGGGTLTIQTRKENYGGNRFTSARLISSRNFKYGVYEIRAKLPYGRGTWPAFWLLAANRPLNWPGDGEIDIMEHVGYDMNTVHATIHCNAYNHMIGTQIGTSTRVNDVANQWHTYTLEWTPNRIIGFVDEQAYFRYDKPSSNYNQWPFDNEFNMILNTAVGGNWGAVGGIDENIYPQSYVIDYVKVWALP